jgi:F-type H+-transporting ATPase subunit b
MHFSWSTFALQIINFAILVGLLNRFLYKPVLRMIDARRAEIAKHYTAAQGAEAEAKEKLAAIEAQRAEIAAERAAALKSAAAEAEATATVRRGASGARGNGVA